MHSINQPAISVARRSFVGTYRFISFSALAPLVSLLLLQPCVAVDFNSDIRPILSEHCLNCHGPDEASRESDLRLDSFAFATADMGGHRGITPGKPEQSELLRRIESDDPDLQMPPGAQTERLATAQVKLLRQWIAEGAEYETHWAYRPIAMPSIPEPANLPPAATVIDRFIVAALQEKNLSLSAPVDKRTLLRRVTFDLIGLPPTWEEVQAFEADDAVDAYPRVVERLLASPHYGERWGRHWLDIARYADTHGGGAIGFQRFAFSYTYRDYVINALNRDVPYDQFVVEQLAADQLGLGDNDPALAGLGFLTVGRQYTNKHDIQDDRIDVVCRGLMGMTVACARCHDHKYDAIPTSDYYALYATFAASEVPRQTPEVGPAADPQAYPAYQAELQRREFRRTETIREQTEVLRHRMRMQVGMYLSELAKGTPEQDLSAAFLSYRTDDYRPQVLERWRKYLATLDANDPVFGPWHQLQALPAEEFTTAAVACFDKLQQENGDISGLNLAAMATEPPRWNPRVLDALRARQPQSMLDVAEAYGQLFASVQEEWLNGLLQAAQEARPNATIIPDEDAPHLVINSSINRQLRYHLYGPQSPFMLTDEEASRLLNRPLNDHVSGLGGAIAELNLNSPGSPPRAMLLRENPHPAPVRIFVRGNPLQRGDEVPPRFLTAITPSLSPQSAAPFRDGHRRLDLARAVVDPGNPLTRRVAVNWVWQRHFGQGLVRTPDDFGVRSESPTHPALLDYLAETFLTEDHWSFKNLHRRIVLSQVYRQGSIENTTARQIDPENRLLWRMPRHRLEVEAMRDAMLAAAGQLNDQMGGRPYDMFSEPFTLRRSVYGFINRDVIAGFFSAFDMADPSVCAAKRPQTSVPQQTLYALNSKFIQAQAHGLTQCAEFLSATDDTQRIETLYRRCFARLATPEEIQDALKYVTAQSGLPPADAWESLAHVLLASNEFIFLD